MTWGLSSTGQVIDLTNHAAAARSLGLPEIAHSLATINRFNGHAVRPISVAEHSILVSYILEVELGVGVRAQLAGLMHDAHETVTGDCTSPIKQTLGYPWHDFEKPHAHAMWHRWGLADTFARYGSVIHKADLIALATERRDLMHPGGPPWPVLHGVQPVAHINLRDRDHITWQDWRAAFEDRFAELTFAINHYTAQATA